MTGTLSACDDEEKGSSQQTGLPTNVTEPESPPEVIRGNFLQERLRTSGNEGEGHDVDFPNEIIVQIAQMLSFEDLINFSKVCHKANEIATSPPLHHHTITPVVEKIIEENSNFRYRKLKKETASAVLIREECNTCIPAEASRKLAWASIMGSPGANLLLAEMSSANHALIRAKAGERVQSFFYKELYFNKRKQYYNNALEKFNEDTNEYNAICLGAAQLEFMDSLDSYDLSDYKNLKKAAKFLLLINDATFYAMSGVVETLMQKLWIGEYDRTISISLVK